MRVLLIDNYDSFTYNLFQLLAVLDDVEPTVVRNDEASWADLERRGFDAVVLSPGPGRPERPADFGVCAEAITRGELPLLGVCLGHQGIGAACGAEVAAAPRPVHGRRSTVVHDGSPLFAGIPERFLAVRYHSLCLRRPLPAEIEEIAWSEDAEGPSVPMAIARRDRPQWGVQFHPESIETEHGRRLLANFCQLAREHRPVAGSGRRGVAPPPPSPRAAGGSAAPRRDAGGLELLTRRVAWDGDPEPAFLALYGASPNAFWLDGEGGGEAARFSFMGDAGGPLGRVVSYDVGTGLLKSVSGDGMGETRAESIFDHLAAQLGALRGLGAGLPFDLRCGFAGYLGYELKAECGGAAAHASPLPDAAFVFAARMIAFDRVEGCAHLLCLADGETVRAAAAEAWLDEAEGALAEAAALAAAEPGLVGTPPAPAGALEASLARCPERYLEDIDACLRLLREGETYEVCLTDSLRARLVEGPLRVYRRLRRLNPSPYSAYLRFGEAALLSSSPERFLRVDGDGMVEARPIKGTTPRGADPSEDAALAARLASDPKTRAENLMIADLLRNDLGSVCEAGSVTVPGLMEVESYATMHQLVTTVRGRLRADVDRLDAVRACFPPGSMTGAPKRRTMAVLDRLEGVARGPYSGVLGYFGPDGACDLSVVIRTIVCDGEQASIGAGGAIVVDSDPNAELDEMLLKAASASRALRLAAGVPA